MVNDNAIPATIFLVFVILYLIIPCKCLFYEKLTADEKGQYMSKEEDDYET